MLRTQNRPSACLNAAKAPLSAAAGEVIVG